METIVAGIIIVLIVVVLSAGLWLWYASIQSTSYEEAPVFAPPIYVGYVVEENNVCALFSVDSNVSEVRVSIISDTPCAGKCTSAGNGLCKVCFPKPSNEEVRIIFPSGYTAVIHISAEATRPTTSAATARIYVAALTFPLSWDVNIELNLYFTLCNSGNSAGDVTASLSDDSNVFFSNTYTIDANNCVHDAALWTPTYTGVHTIRAAVQGGNALEANIYIGQHMINHAPAGGTSPTFWVQEALSGGTTSTFWTQEAVSGGTSSTFWSQEALSGGTWNCPDDLNCFATPLE